MAKEIFELIRKGDHAGLKAALAGDAAAADAQNHLQESPLHLAASLGDAESTRLLLAAGADPDGGIPAWLGRPVVYALWHGREAVVRALLEAGAGVGESELHAAIRKCQALIDPLVEAGAYDGRVAGRDAPLWQALSLLSRGDREGLAALLAGHPDLVQQTDAQGARLLHEAAAIAEPDVVALLVERGADLEAVNGDGRTALEIAQAHGRVTCVAALVQAGADVTVLPDPRAYQHFSRPHKDGAAPVDGAEQGGLVVRHEPNPCDQHESVLYAEPPCHYAWFYQSFLENRADTALEVVWFDHFEQWDGTWYPGNIKGRPLSGLDFVQWYGDGSAHFARPRIEAGKRALCKVNWHCAHEPEAVPHKWAYRAVDAEGRAHYAESTIVSLPAPAG